MLRTQDLSVERFRGEVVLIDFRSGLYGSFTGTAADIFWLVSESMPREKWLEILGHAYPSIPDTAESEIMEFVEGLLSKGIFVMSNDEVSGDANLPDDLERREWSKPELKFEDDLADLLVIDPIHDSAETGWPERNQ